MPTAFAVTERVPSFGNDFLGIVAGRNPHSWIPILRIARGPGGRAPYWNGATSGSGVSACGERSRAGNRYLFHIVRTDTKFSRGFPQPESRNFDKLRCGYPQGSG